MLTALFAPALPLAFIDFLSLAARALAGANGEAAAAEVAGILAPPVLSSPEALAVAAMFRDAAPGTRPGTPGSMMPARRWADFMGALRARVLGLKSSGPDISSYI